MPGREKAIAVEDLAEDESYDPFEAFAQFTGSGSVPDPFPRFAELRRLGPVHEGDIWNLVGLETPAGMTRGSGSYSTLTYETCTHVFRDPTTFSSTIHAQSMGPLMGHTILEMDDPEHKRYRGLVEQAFTRKAMARWETQAIRPVVESFIDVFVGRGRADLVREFTFPFPVHVITALLGLPEEDLPLFHRLAFMLTNTSDFKRAMAASRKLHDFLDGVIEHRRAEPGTGDDLVSALVAAELDGHRLSNEEITAFVRLLLPAGSETTYHSSGNLLYGLLTHPDQLGAVRRDRSLVHQTIEEGLRWEPPLTGIPRLVMRDTEIAGTPIPQGSVVHTILASANRDESRWERPEEFDVHRPQRPHIAFAFGPHVCLGQHLARLETAVALNALLDRLPNLRLDPDAASVRIEGLVFRSPHALPVVFG